MVGRVQRVVVHFPSAFRLASVDAIQPAGAYAIDVQEAVMAREFHGPANPAGLRIHLAGVVDGRWVLRPVPLTRSELGLAILDGHGLGVMSRQQAD